MQKTATSWVEVDLRRLEANLAAVRALLGGEAGPAVCGVVKANAYGLGAVPIAQRLALRGAAMLAVFSADQARELAGEYAGPLLVLGFVDRIERADALYRAAVTGRLHLTVHSLEQLQALTATGKEFGCALPVHLFLDTGMSRSGLSDTDFPSALRTVAETRYVRLAGVSTHMASADDDADLTELQLARLDAAVREHRELIGHDATIHIANTFATLRDARYHMDMVRIGLCLYGYGPQIMDIETPVKLEPIVRWRSRIVHMRRFPRGVGVGYNQTMTLNRESVLGIVPAGYADGYHLALSNKASVRLPDLNIDAPIVGKVNMDQIIIDLTDAPTAQVGTTVDLYSNDPDAPSSVPHLARLAGSSIYEMLCRLNARLPRQYVR